MDYSNFSHGKIIFVDYLDFPGFSFFTQYINNILNMKINYYIYYDVLSAV